MIEEGEQGGGTPAGLGEEMGGTMEVLRLGKRGEGRRGGMGEEEGELCQLL